MGDVRRGVGVVNPRQLAMVVAFDPGQTTGWCALGVHPDDLRWPRGLKTQELIRYLNYGQIDCHTQGFDGWADTAKKHAGLNLHGENDGVDKMLGITFQYPRCAIVFEDFILDFSQATSDRHTLSPVRMTSAFSFGLQYQGGNLTDIHVQNRSLAKTTATDARLKNWGLYDRNSGPHARDAVRHAFYFMRECSEHTVKGDEKKFMAWPHIFPDPINREEQQKKAESKRAKKIGERIPKLR